MPCRLLQVVINPAIAGRDYQQEAIRRITEAFAAGKRRALMVMATGTGKTRTTVALVDLFLRANQARRILFVADRDALVDQALNDAFRPFLPNEPSGRIFSHNIETDKRLYVVTLQTLSKCFPEFSPAFFDLIVFDEAHRSLFNKFTDVMDYFDARMIGLTATPANFLDRDTFRVFQCDDQTPTALYTYKEAVDDKHLVDFILYQAQSGFQRDGIKGVDLSEEEQNALIEAGIDPDELDYEGTDVEKTVTNADTLRKQWEEFMETCYKDEAGQYPGKTIVFAMTQKHAERLRQSFEAMYPQFVGMVEVITSDTERVRDGSYGDGLITKFKKNDLPRIAISVDMLDTGVDIPEIVNLVFMKPVRSQIKMWQMIGRGTRNHEACRYYDRLPDGHKSGFLILDFWQNEFNRQAEEKVAAALPVMVSLFNTRLKILESFHGQQADSTAQQARADLRAMIERVPQDTFTVKKMLGQIEAVWTDEFWNYLSPAKTDLLRVQVAPLLRFAPNVDVQAETFNHKMERLKLAGIKGKEDAKTVQSIAEDVGRIPTLFTDADPQLKVLSDLCTSGQIVAAKPETLTEIARKFAPLMSKRSENLPNLRVLDLADVIANAGYITLSEGGERIHVTQYKERVEERVRALLDADPVIAALREGREVSDFDLIAMERTLREQLGTDDIQLTTDNIRRAYGLNLSSLLGLVRHLLDIEVLPQYPELVEKTFEGYLQEHQPPFAADQIRFLRAAKQLIIRRRHLNLNDLYSDGAFSSFGDDAVERLFSEGEIGELMQFAERLRA